MYSKQNCLFNVYNELKWLKIKGMDTFLKWFRIKEKNFFNFCTNNFEVLQNLI